MGQFLIEWLMEALGVDEVGAIRVVAGALLGTSLLLTVIATAMALTEPGYWVLVAFGGGAMLTSACIGGSTG